MVEAQRKVGGQLAYVVATRLDERLGDLSFEQALAVARLVLTEKGQLVPVTKRQGALPMSLVTSLARLELVDICDASQSLAVHSVDSVRSFAAVTGEPEWLARATVVGTKTVGGPQVRASQLALDLVLEIVRAETAANPS